MPITVPVLEEDAVELVILTRIARAQVNGHILGAFRVDEEAMDLSGFGRHFTVGVCDFASDTVTLDAHEAGFDFEILGLVVVEVEGGPAGTVRGVEEVFELLVGGCVEGVLVGLAEEETSPRRRFEEFGR